MKTMILAVFVVLLLVPVVPVRGGDDVQARKVYYEAAITQAIADCHQKSKLRSSRSPNLRLKAHREASKALFLETHKTQLVDSMLVMNVEPKPYKVERFLNDRFSCTCYAQWTPPGSI
jgi:hypothetical protein